MPPSVAVPDRRRRRPASAPISVATAMLAPTTRARTRRTDASARLPAPTQSARPTRPRVASPGSIGSARRRPTVGGGSRARRGGRPFRRPAGSARGRSRPSLASPFGFAAIIVLVFAAILAAATTIGDFLSDDYEQSSGQQLADGPDGNERRPVRSTKSPRPCLRSRSDCCRSRGSELDARHSFVATPESPRPKLVHSRHSLSLRAGTQRSVASGSPRRGPSLSRLRRDRAVPPVPLGERWQGLPDSPGGKVTTVSPAQLVIAGRSVATTRVPMASASKTGSPKPSASEG